MNPKFTKLETAGGIPIFHMHIPWIKTVHCGVLVKTGTRDEIWPKEAGLAHAMEHMLFQGTELFPDPMAISSYIEDVGGEINAWTSHEGTFFWQIIPSEFFCRSLHLLNQMLTVPTFPKEKTGVEMNNIIQEIKKSNDEPGSFLENRFSELLFHPHPLSRDILGTEKSVGSFEKKDFLDFLGKWYKNSNFIMIVAGNVSEGETLELAYRNFSVGSLPATAILFTDSVKRKKGKNPEGIEFSRVYFRDIEQAHMALGYLLGPASTRDTLVLQFFAAMIGGGMSFPLFQVVRNENGLCYEIGVTVKGNSDFSSFCIYVGTDPENYRKAEQLILRVIQDSKKDKNLLEKTRTSMLGKLALVFEDIQLLVHSAAENILAESGPKGYDEIKEEINSVTIEEVEAAVDKYLAPETTAGVVLLPKPKETGKS